jgi:uncharacterized short protein YbdD (DUF466 family)
VLLEHEDLFRGVLNGKLFLAFAWSVRRSQDDLTIKAYLESAKSVFALLYHMSWLNLFIGLASYDRAVEGRGNAAPENVSMGKENARMLRPFGSTNCKLNKQAI